MTLRYNISSQPSFPRSIFLAIIPNRFMLFCTAIWTQNLAHTYISVSPCLLHIRNQYIFRRCEYPDRTHMRTASKVGWFTNWAALGRKQSCPHRGTLSVFAWRHGGTQTNLIAQPVSRPRFELNTSEY
jgi:hypothetical protein